MVVGMELNSAPGAAGTQGVTIKATVLFRDTSSGVQQVYKVWEESKKVGTVAGGAFLQGVVPNRLRSGIKDYFRGFTASVNRAKLKARREASGK